MSIARAKIKFKVTQSVVFPSVVPEWGIKISAESQGFILPDGFGKFIPYSSREEAEAAAAQFGKAIAKALADIVVDSRGGSLKIRVSR